MNENNNTVQIEMANVVREIIHEKSYVTDKLPNKNVALTEYEIGSFVYLNNQYESQGKTLYEGTYQFINKGNDNSTDCWIRIINEKGELLIDNGSIKIEDSLDENSENLVTNKVITASINGLQLQINANKDLLSDYKILIDKNSSNISTLDTRVTTNDGKLSNHDTRINNNKDEINTLTSVTENHETRISTNESDITTLQNRASSIENVNSSQTYKISKNTTDISKAQEDISDNSDKISNNTTDIYNLSTRVDNINSTLSTNIETLDDKSIKYSDIVSDKVEGAKKVLGANYGKQLRDDVDRIDADCIRVEDSDIAIDSIDENLAADAIRKTPQNFNTEQQQIARNNINAANNDDVTFIVTKTNELESQLNSDVSSLSGRIDTIETSVANQEERVVNAENTVSDVVEKVNVCDRARVEQDVKLVEYGTLINNNTREINDHDFDIRQNTLDITNLTTTVSDNNTAITTRVDGLDESSLKYVDIVDDTTGGENKVLSANAGKGIRYDVDAHGLRLDNIESVNTTQGQTLEQHTTSISELTTTDSGLRTDIDRIDNDALRAEDVDTEISSIDESVVNNAVRVTSQTFTEDQKQIARANIGALSREEIIALIQQELQK